uniref:Uncharacterized protein n=1 Tax=Rhizophora mucronata TaxID=61149 RepID=A0A2P2N2G2_RHIMU
MSKVVYIIAHKVGKKNRGHRYKARSWIHKDHKRC